MIENIIGHEQTKKLIEISTASAKERNENIPHLLFSGAAGCGKTTMGMEMAKASDVDFLPVSPDDFSDRDPVIRILEKLDHTNYDERGNRTGILRPTIIFVDEIHRLPKKGQEILGIAMEKFLLETGKTNKYYWIPYFTLVGATTDDGSLTKPFREKFKLRILFDTYADDQIFQMIIFHATRLNVLISHKAARKIAKRSRGVPRTAIGYLERSRDYSQYLGAKVITSEAVLKNFKNMGIDSKGLTVAEIKILKALYVSKDPIGLDNLAIVSNEAKKNISQTIEPFLIRLGLMIRANKGRIITDVGRQHLEGDGYLGNKLKKVEIEPDYKRS